MKDLYKYLIACFMLSLCLLSNANTVDNLSLSVDGFIENKGQMLDAEDNPIPFVLFKTEAPGVNLWITEKGMTMQTLQIRKESLTGKELKSTDGELSGKKKSKKIIDWERIDLTLKGATIKKENIIKEKETQAHNNYFYSHCPDGIYGVKEYQKVTIQSVYPNIDWVIYRSSESFKYDFIIHPGGDYKQIELVYHSKTPIQINEQGQLDFTTSYHDLYENKPVSFYKDKEINTQFVQNYQHTKTINGDIGYETSISFYLNEQAEIFEANLIIDPQLNWSTFYGGFDEDIAETIDVDSSGNVFIAGNTFSSNFPSQNPFFGAYFQGVYSSNGDIVILKFNNNGNRIWSTYYGGNGYEFPHSLKTDISGNVFITGNTSSSNFPIQNGGTYYQPSPNDMFILKFNNNGNRLWATYYGGSNTEAPYDIDIDVNDNIYIAGSTYSTDLPTLNAGTFFQSALTNPGYSDAFIVKFDNLGNLLWATYYGGADNDNGTCIETDNLGNVFVSGITRSTNLPLQNSGTYYQSSHAGGLEDVFIIKFDNLGNRLWATYYGGNGGTTDEERPEDIVTDSNGNLFVVGHTFSTSFPLLNSGTFFQGTNAGLRDMFILKFDNLGNRLWATFYGGTSDDLNWEYMDIANVDNCDNLYISFMTWSPSLQVIAPNIGSYTDNYNASQDGYIARFSNAGDLNWATYWGGDKRDERSSFALDDDNNIFMVGEWTLVTNPISYTFMNPGGGAYFDNTFNGGYSDMFITKFISDTNCFVSEPTLISSFIPSSTSICEGDSISFNDNSSGSNIYSWNWTFNGGTPSSSTTQGPHNVVFNTVGNYTINLQVADSSGSDDTSIVVIVSPNYSSTQNSTICKGDSILFNGNYYSSGGFHTDSLQSIFGCDSLLSLNLTVDSVDISVTQNGNQLTATQNGATYQWLDCNNGNAVINGETSQNFIPTVTGNYAVEITKGSCNDTSECKEVMLTGINNISNENEVSIYPSPTKGSFTISLSKINKNETAIVYDVLGKVIVSNQLKTKNTLIDLSGNNKGIYFINIQTENEIIVRKIILQ